MVYGERAIDFAHLPRVHGDPVFHGTYRAAPDDFRVEEILGFEPAGEGPHYWLKIQKIGISTDEAQTRLAQAVGVSRKEVGYAGKKDTHAVAIQWMSVPESAHVERGPIDDALTICEVTRNQRKLKIGQLAGNRFELVLTGEANSSLEDRLSMIARQGVANFFGPQRFGRHGTNLQNARRLATRDPQGKRRLHPKDGMAASAARSAAFNAIVAARIECDRWLSVAVGDVVSLAGRGSHFAVSATQFEDVCARILNGALDPTAPMAGRSLKTGESQAADEWAVLHTDALLSGWLTGVFREADRRAVRVIPKQLVWKQQGSKLKLSFELPRGAFATAVLHELGVLSESRA